VAQAEQHLLCKHEALSSNPSPPSQKKEKKKKEPIKFQWTNSTGNLKKSKMNECKDRIAH
jgi:hypothetical protein